MARSVSHVSADVMVRTKLGLVVTAAVAIGAHLQSASGRQDGSQEAGASTVTERLLEDAEPPRTQCVWVGLAIACQHPSLGGVEQPRTMVFATTQNASGSQFLGPGSPLCHGAIHTVTQSSVMSLPLGSCRAACEAATRSSWPQLELKWLLTSQST
eukprot:COSAG01_NODE_15398_length_1342_cov_2.244969_2_plen_156_part_00